MKYVTLFLAFLLISICVFGQKNIKNTLTSEHVHVLGTRCSIILPEGFEKTNRFLGFVDNEYGSSIVFFDLAAPAFDFVNNFNADSLLKVGVKVDSIEDLMLNELPARFIVGTQELEDELFVKYILIFGNEKETYFVNAHVLAEFEDDIGDEIKRSLLTMYYDANITINPFEIVNYSLDYASSPLVYASKVSNMLMFTKDGASPPQIADKTCLMTAQSLGLVNIIDRKNFSIDRYKQLAKDSVEIESIKEITIDGMPGYEIIGNGKDKKTMEVIKIYQTILFGNFNYYILYSITNKDFDVNIDMVKNVVKTFKRK